MKPKSPRTVARELVESQLEKNLQDLDRQVRHTKARIKALVAEQTVAKRQRSEIGNLLKAIRSGK